MIKLTYTDEMVKQDHLWQSEEEDIDKMLKLYEDILTEAKSYGFSQSYIMYEAKGEAVIELYDDEEAFNKGKEESEMFGFCRPLISYIEEVLNY